MPALIQPPNPARRGPYPTPRYHLSSDAIPTNQLGPELRVCPDHFPIPSDLEPFLPYCAFPRPKTTTSDAGAPAEASQVTLHIPFTSSLAPSGRVIPSRILIKIIYGASHHFVAEICLTGFPIVVRSFDTVTDRTLAIAAVTRSFFVNYECISVSYI